MGIVSVCRKNNFVNIGKNFENPPNQKKPDEQGVGKNS